MAKVVGICTCGQAGIATQWLIAERTDRYYRSSARRLNFNVDSRTYSISEKSLHSATFSSASRMTITPLYLWMTMPSYGDSSLEGLYWWPDLSSSLYISKEQSLFGWPAEKRPGSTLWQASALTYLRHTRTITYNYICFKGTESWDRIQIFLSNMNSSGSK